MEMLDTCASDDTGRLRFQFAICLQVVYSLTQAIGHPDAYSNSRYSMAQSVHTIVDATGDSHHSENLI